MTDSKKQQKDSCDPVVQRSLHDPPPKIIAAVYHGARPAAAGPDRWRTGSCPAGAAVFFREAADAWTRAEIASGGVNSS
jgi:hypothetical protein